MARHRDGATTPGVDAISLRVDHSGAEALLGTLELASIIFPAEAHAIVWREFEGREG